MDLLTTRFSTGDVVRLADVSNANMQSWLKRGIIVGHRDGDDRFQIEGAGRSGKHRSFSWFNLSEIAIAASLMQIGINSPHDAFRAAQGFSHTSTGSSSSAKEEGLSASEPERWPGLPFHYLDGDTYLYVSGPKSTVVRHTDGKAQLHTIHLALGNSAGFVAFNVTTLFMQIAERLGQDGRVLLDTIYKAEMAA